MTKSLFTKSDVKKFDFHGEKPSDGKKFIKHLITDLQEQGFEEQFDISVKDAIGSALQMVPKISSKENKKNEAMKLKNTVKEISSKYNENSLQNILKENISFSQWDRQRKSNSLETSNNSRNRSSVGNFENYTFNKVQFLADIRNLKQGDVVNWSQLARDFNVNINGVLPSNGGQVLKEFAQVNGIDTDLFNVDRKISGRDYKKQRRQKKKINDVSLPSAPTAKFLRSELRTKISNGEYAVGEKINPITNSKIMYKDGKLVHATEQVFGRKIPLELILQKELDRADAAGILRATYNGKIFYTPANIENVDKEICKYGIDVKDLTPDERCEKLLLLHTTRHIKQWSDHGVVASKGHYLHMIQILYDDSVFLTDEELKRANPNTKISNVQTFVEQPQTYILAQAPSSTSSCLQYAKPQMEDIQRLSEFKSTASNGMLYANKLRVTSVDGPERQLKSGHQKGGNYRCICGVATKQHRNIVHCYGKKHKSLEEKRDFVVKGKLYRNSTFDEPNPFKNPSKKDLKNELISRKQTISKNQTKAELNEQVKNILEGQQRVPDFLFDAPSANFSTLNLSSWEVPEMEFMHDFSNMYSNFIDELPSHIENDAARKEIEKLFLKSKGERQHFRGCDARLTAVHFASLCLKLYEEEKIDYKLLQLSQTFVEVSKIGYSSYTSRNQKTIFRLHNLCFTIALLLDDIIPNPKKLSSSKWYGSHYHSMTVHFPMWYRLFNIKSLLPENEEATFHKIRQIVQSTSSRKPSHVIENSILRLQFQKVDPTSFESQIKIQTKALPKLGNTNYKFEDIKRRQSIFQSHFQRISDYLLQGNLYWKMDEHSVIFLDAEDEKCHSVPTMFHFRTNTMKDVEAHLQDCWSDCVKRCKRKKLVIPLPYIKVYDGDRHEKISGNCKGLFVT